MKYIHQAEAARVIGISKQALSKRIQRGTFIRGYMVVDAKLQTKQLRFKLSDVLEFAKNRKASRALKV